VVSVSWGLGAVDRETEGGLGQGAGWLGVLVSGGSELGLWIDRLKEGWVKELDGRVQQQIGHSAWCVGDGEGRLKGVVA
jgi:hypothetical protein